MKLKHSSLSYTSSCCNLQLYGLSSFSIALDSCLICFKLWPLFLCLFLSPQYSSVHGQTPSEGSSCCISRSMLTELVKKNMQASSLRQACSLNLHHPKACLCLAVLALSAARGLCQRITYASCTQSRQTK